MTTLRRPSTLLVAVSFFLASILDAQGHFPWKEGDTPPPLAGLTLAMNRATIDSLLGQPSDSQQLGTGVRALGYATRGISLVVSDSDGLSIIYIRKREAASIDSLRVGDTTDKLLTRWGKPDDGNAHSGFYIRGRWVLIVRLDDSDARIVELGLAFTAGNQ